ncbi:SpoIIE family protein phosphatase [Trichormus sp. NMC-1]|uniref:SpoIIE family protein phosphatase n=1 Tax=Trichormus sp. NMC-1 TaxID=1853259 RepID=UPI001F011386|nr:SpoIIE family protein phosphatase [Trichormus sp. NMC-1]
MYVFSDGVYEVELPDGTLWKLNDFINLLTRCNHDFLNLDDVLAAIKTATASQSFTDDCSLLEINFASSHPFRSSLEGY